MLFVLHTGVEKVHMGIKRIHSDFYGSWIRLILWVMKYFEDHFIIPVLFLPMKHAHHPFGLYYFGKPHQALITYTASVHGIGKLLLSER